jgi:energy-coupling factor transporter transmembrane protein EcfT
MRLFDLRLLLLWMVVSSLIFIADIIFSLGAISLCYIFLMLITFWFAKTKFNMVGSVLVSVSLTIIGWLYQTRFVKSFIDIGIIQAELDYEGLFRTFSIIILIFVGGVLLYQRSRDEELERLNETLELKILSRSAASEAKAKRLEQQIIILQTIDKQEVSQSLSKLDDVIKELRELTEAGELW